MTDADDFDCFLSHNSKDRPAVLALAARLAELGVRVWLDAEQVRPGTRWQDGLEQGIEACRTVAVLVGPHGAGPWQEEEMQAALDLAARRGLPVFAVLLPGVSDSPGLSVFLRNRSWVDLRAGLDDPTGLDRLVWGITGTRPGLEAPGRDAPAPLNPFLGDSVEPIGRDQEVGRILEKLRAGNHCSLVGPSGSGKTALLQAIRARLPGELRIRADQIVWINCRTVSGLRGLQSAIVCELGGDRPAQWRGLIAARSLRLLLLDDLGGMDPGPEGLKQRRWLRGLDDQFRTKLLMVSNERLDVLFRRDDPLRDSPLMGLDPVPVELGPLGVADCGRLVDLRLAGIGHRVGDYADLYREPRQPRDLLGRCAERFERLRQGQGGCAP